MESTFVAAFSDSAQATFRDMFGLSAVDSGSRELGRSEEHGWDVTGLVGIAGKAQGAVALRLSQTMLASLLECTGVGADAADKKQLESALVGELINIIAGHAISALSSIEMDIAPPVIVRGPNHKIGWPYLAPVEAISFTLPSGAFELDLCIKH